MSVKVNAPTYREIADRSWMEQASVGELTLKAGSRPSL